MIGKMIGVQLLLLVLLMVSMAYAKFSSKTAYMDRFNSTQLEFINEPLNYRIAGCRPEQIYILLRHGARSPSMGQVSKSKLFLETYREFKKRKSVERGLQADEGEEATATGALDQVEATFANGPYYALTDLGIAEMKSIAQRFRARYPRLFDPSVARAGQMDILSSDKSRSIESAHSFVHGLYDTDSADLVDVLLGKMRVNNTIMRLFDECERYTAGVKKNMSAGVELTRFENGPEMRKLIEQFIERNRIHGMEFKPSVVRKLFTLCTIEMAHRMKENWCKIFSKEDFEILAYHNDLKSYWLKSYGHDVNAKVALLLYKDLFSNIESLIENITTTSHHTHETSSKESTSNGSQRVLLRFGHAENIIPMVSVLNLFRDAQELRADNFGENVARKFRTGDFSPFSANLAFVLHRCPHDEDETAKYKIHVLLNELPVKIIDGGNLTCATMNPKNSRLSDDGSLCDLGHFHGQLERFVNEDFARACSVTETSGGGRQISNSKSSDAKINEDFDDRRRRRRRRR